MANRNERNRNDFQTCYFNLGNDKQTYNMFVSKRINESESNDRIQFKIIHLKSKTDREENFDVKMNSATWQKIMTQQEEMKKRATKSVEKYDSGHGKRSRVEPKFLLGR